MPCDNKQPIRYLVPLNRHDTVKQLRSGVIASLGEDESWDLMIAEVFDNHVARVLVSFIHSLTHAYSFTCLNSRNTHVNYNNNNNSKPCSD